MAKYSLGEEREKDTEKLRSQRYGFFRVLTEPITIPKCYYCQKELTSESVVINKTQMCKECFNAKGDPSCE